MSRGRPLSDPTKSPRYPNPLRKLRIDKGLSQQELAERTGLDFRVIGKLERGEQRLRADHIAVLKPVLEASAPVWLGEVDIATIPIRYRIAAFGAGLDRAELEPITPPGYARPSKPVDEAHHCFAAEIADDSADLLYPKGSVLVARRLTSGPESLALDGRTKYVVAFYRADLGSDDLMEILVGILDRRIDGALTLITRSSNRQVPNQPPIRRTVMNAQLGEATAAFLHERRTPTFDYTSQASDAGLILGRVEWAERPE